MKLSILICHLPERKHLLQRLKACLEVQDLSDVEIIVYETGKEKTVGEKRNWLLDKAQGEYLCFCDDDDLVSENYIELVMAGINKGVDCCSLVGEITENGQNPKTFIHSIQYKTWFERNGTYFRNTNHLNVVKSSIAKQMRFPEKNHGEDRDYSEQLLKSGLLITEHWISDVIYYYDHKSKK